MNVKPLIFVDLDDTLFQTHRKSTPTPLHKIATTDKLGEPLSYMLRAVCSHGGTILGANKQVDQEWLVLQQQATAELEHLLNDLPNALLDYAKPFGSIRTWTVEENGGKIYTVAKQNDPEPLFLSKIIANLPAEVLEHCYVHINGNNLAIIPKFVSKQKAVEFFINKYDPERERAILGWGDSLSDAGFLACCDWFGMPKNSQLAKFLAQSLMQDHNAKGYLGHG